MKRAMVYFSIISFLIPKCSHLRVIHFRYWRRTLGRVFNLIGTTFFTLSFLIAYYGFLLKEPPDVYMTLGGSLQPTVILIALAVSVLGTFISSITVNSFESAVCMVFLCIAECQNNPLPHRSGTTADLMKAIQDEHSRFAFEHESHYSAFGDHSYASDAPMGDVGNNRSYRSVDSTDIPVATVVDVQDFPMQNDSFTQATRVQY